MRAASPPTATHGPRRPELLLRYRQEAVALNPLCELDYEFLALDKALTSKQREELRQLSTRAEITATRFTNVYHWGSFRGDPAQIWRATSTPSSTCGSG